MRKREPQDTIVSQDAEIIEVDASQLEEFLAANDGTAVFVEQHGNTIRLTAQELLNAGFAAESLEESSMAGINDVTANGDRGRIRECETHACSDGPPTGANVGFLRPPQQLEAGGNVMVWLRRFEDYALDSGIETERWCSVAMSLLSDGIYEVVEDNGLNRLSSFEQLSAFLKTRYCRPESAVERYLAFQRRKQSATESALVFGEAVRTLGRHAGIAADEVLRDQYITGLFSDKVLESLLCHPPETFDQAVEHARRAEEAVALLKTMAISPNRQGRPTEERRNTGPVITGPLGKRDLNRGITIAGLVVVQGILGDNAQ
uniref:Retrotransposon gag domain-containing protein n=1 Tax=Trichuris muris TaxID=70415 RepID=A0A5S6R5F4_TRIMR